MEYTSPPDLGFIHALRAIVRLLPKQRQTLFFSATMPDQIVQLTREMLHNPATINLQRKAAPAHGITQAVYPVPQELKSALLHTLLERNLMEEALVFTRTKHRANRLWEYLTKRGVNAARIHGNRSQKQREDVDVVRTALRPVHEESRPGPLPQGVVHVLRVIREHAKRAVPPHNRPRPREGLHEDRRRPLGLGKLAAGESREWTTTLGVCTTEKEKQRRCALPDDATDRADGVLALLVAAGWWLAAAAPALQIAKLAFDLLPFASDPVLARASVEHTARILNRRATKAMPVYNPADGPNRQQICGTLPDSATWLWKIRPAPRRPGNNCTWSVIRAPAESTR